MTVYWVDDWSKIDSELERLVSWKLPGRGSVWEYVRTSFMLIEDLLFSADVGVAFVQFAIEDEML